MDAQPRKLGFKGGSLGIAAICFLVLTVWQYEVFDVAVIPSDADSMRLTLGMTDAPPATETVASRSRPTDNGVETSPSPSAAGGGGGGVTADVVPPTVPVAADVASLNSPLAVTSVVKKHKHPAPPKFSEQASQPEVAEPSRHPNVYRKLAAPENPGMPWVETRMKAVNPDVLISIIIATYAQDSEVVEQIERWATYSPRFLTHVEFIIVDDGSNSLKLALRRIQRHLKHFMRIKIVALNHDIGFNQGGACNTGALEAVGQTYSFLDVDHWYDPQRAELLLDIANETVIPQHEDGVDVFWRFPREDLYYRENSTRFIEKFGSGGMSRKLFSRWNLDHSSPNCVLVHRDAFWKTGGYDEDYAGLWGWNDMALADCAKRHKIPFHDLRTFHGKERMWAWYRSDQKTTTKEPKVLFGANYEMYMEKKEKHLTCNNYAVARVPYTVLMDTNQAVDVSLANLAP